MPGAEDAQDLLAPVAARGVELYAPGQQAVEGFHGFSFDKEEHASPVTPAYAPLQRAGGRGGVEVTEKRVRLALKNGLVDAQ